MSSYYVIAFILGLQATLHCVGMCGPLAFAAPFDRSTKWKAYLGSFLYNLGRISGYSYLGFLVGLIGISAYFLQSIQVISISTGILLLISTFKGSLENWYIIRFFSQKWGNVIASLFPVLKTAPNRLKALLFGMLNGFLPCGMVYLALLHALSAPSLLSSILAMVSYGLGTLPVMLLLPLMNQQSLKKYIHPIWQKIGLLCVGLLLILRGLNLGIPFISPSIELPTDAHQQPSVECCKAIQH
ncbi:MAG: hypothetical protein RLZZ301_332 [Bacteroidota bacterium]|jgi:sulfite exporter TauE/SafE